MRGGWVADYLIMYLASPSKLAYKVDFAAAWLAASWGHLRAHTHHYMNTRWPSLKSKRPRGGDIAFRVTASRRAGVLRAQFSVVRPSMNACGVLGDD